MLCSLSYHTLASVSDIHLMLTITNFLIMCKRCWNVSPHVYVWAKSEYKSMHNKTKVVEKVWEYCRIEILYREMLRKRRRRAEKKIHSGELTCGQWH